MRILAGAPKPARAYLEDFGVKLQACEPVLFSSLGPKFDFSFGTRLVAIVVSLATSKQQKRRPECNKNQAGVRAVCVRSRSTRRISRALRARSAQKTMLRLVSVALAVSTVAALQPPSRAPAAAKANPAAIDVYSRATATSAARDVALYGLFGPSEAEKRAEQARLDAEQEALNERFRKESESDFAFMSVFGVVTCGRGVLGMCLRV